MTTSKSTIALPVRYEATKEYGGDVVNMSGWMENGFWYDCFKIIDANGKMIAGIDKKSHAKQIAKCINEHERLSREHAAMKEALEQIAKPLPTDSKYEHINKLIQDHDRLIGCPQIARKALATLKGEIGSDEPQGGDAT